MRIEGGWNNRDEYAVERRQTEMWEITRSDQINLNRGMRQRIFRGCRGATHYDCCYIGGAKVLAWDGIKGGWFVAFLGGGWCGSVGKNVFLVH